ncbi:MAG: precorrin-3B C(17)-methyltransferase [Alphaproteobacteria bacterium]
MNPPAIIILSALALPLAQRIAAAFPASTIHGPAGRVGGAGPAITQFTDLAAHLAGLFADGRPIIGLCASGILIRSLAPVLRDKHNEPPVLAVAEDGSAVVPLLGGHHGANTLAGRIAEILGCSAAITTASDLALGVALDAPPPGYHLANLGNPGDVKAFTARLLAGEKTRLSGPAPWLEGLGFIDAQAGELCISVTEKIADPSAGHLVYHPEIIALGVGCERGCDAGELDDLVHRTLAQAGIAPAAIAVVASIDLKEDEDAVVELAQRLSRPARYFTADELEAQAPRLANPSALVFDEVGCHGVCEGAALACVGASGALIVAKQKSARATCAVARSANVLDPAKCGRPRGHLAVVGLGPGAAAWRTPQATALIAQAGDLVGYSLYLDLAGPLGHGQTRHDFALGEEADRVAHALGLAAKGHRVALVCSGDPGIFALASLVFEMVEGGPAARRRIEIEVAPGITAMQAGAARAGAPLGHDFCAISLSDLLTPRHTIETRLLAAATGDFVTSFYNPASKRRRTLLPRAREIFLRHRPPKTPVIVASNLGREGELVTVTTLRDFDPATVDMLTLVIFGSSTSRVVERAGAPPWIFTPRGYHTGASQKDGS